MHWCAQQLDKCGCMVGSVIKLPRALSHCGLRPRPHPQKHSVDGLRVLHGVEGLDGAVELLHGQRWLASGHLVLQPQPVAHAAKQLGLCASVV